MKFRTATKSRAVAAILLFASFGALASAATLVNINTADVATLETLNGIGPSKAQAIVDYRTQHGAFQKIEDIQNVSGIGPSTYANIKDYITVGDPGSGQSTQTADQPQSTSTQQSQSSQAQATSNTGSLPPVITAKITTNAKAVAGGGTVFDGSAYNSAGEPLTAGVRYMWNFGDGSVAEGAHTLHTYRYPGTYSVELVVAYNFSTASARLSLPAVTPNLALVAEGDGSLTIYNQGTSDLDVGLWSLLDGSAKPFVIPQDTVVLAGEGVRFSASATGLSGSRDAVLLYPNGTQAASATVGQQSPLRGERVVAVPLAHVAISTPKQDSSSATDTQLAAVAAAAPVPSQGLPWLPVGGLAVLLAAGGAGAWYTGRMRPSVAAETPASEDEFELED